MRESSPPTGMPAWLQRVRSGVADPGKTGKAGEPRARLTDPPQRIGARPAPNAVKMRVSGRITGATSGKSPTGS